MATGSCPQPGPIEITTGMGAEKRLHGNKRGLGRVEAEEEQDELPSRTSGRYANPLSAFVRCSADFPMSRLVRMYPACIESPRSDSLATSSWSDTKASRDLFPTSVHSLPL
jgi:hypothetical protein